MVSHQFPIYLHLQGEPRSTASLSFLRAADVARLERGMRSNARLRENHSSGSSKRGPASAIDSSTNGEAHNFPMGSQVGNKNFQQGVPQKNIRLGERVHLALKIESPLVEDSKGPTK